MPPRPGPAASATSRACGAPGPGEADGAALTDLADQSGMAPSTVHRLLTSLA
ncbi:helix-turn-helix domain-containing protein, partial [Achromobacter pulmonis]|uniref:helix-turn-helix domain-containing protein n=1 Tax=Achromobacter pulmonis TaxID=1389932 RepID=UPI003C7859F7